MNGITFVIGGCRSGKSRHALNLASSFPGNRKVYVATCVPDDEEMAQRVARHQKERGEGWATREVPVMLPEAILEESVSADVLLVDCLTLWISNLFLEQEDVDAIAGHVERLNAAMARAACPIVVVSNEVGAGIVPENRLARIYRDAVGFANQSVAGQADHVIWMVAGIPVTIKRSQALEGNVG